MIKKLLIGSAICLSMVGCKEKNYITPEMLNQLEIDAHCDDLLYYLQADLEEGRIDSLVFNSYTWNINEIKRRNNE